MSERIKKEIKQIDYDKTQEFFKNRAEKFKDSNPYSVTMYQDSNPQLVEKRNRKETEKLFPLLKLDEESKVLDIACGIGRWSDAIHTEIAQYCGVDFSEGLIEIARERNKKSENRSFLVGGAASVEKVLAENNKGKFNRVLMIGIFVYLNDEDVNAALAQVERICEEHAVVCIREPIGIEERLTLDNIFSEELEDNYSAIYRTRSELMAFFGEHLLNHGFELREEAYLFEEDGLNNRKETAQYYFVFER